MDAVKALDILRNSRSYPEDVVTEAYNTILPLVKPVEKPAPKSDKKKTKKKSD